MKYTPSAFIDSIGHLILEGFVLLCLADLIHIPSVFAQFIIKPGTRLKESSILKSAKAEFLSDKVAVLSSAYRKSFVSCFFDNHSLYVEILSNGIANVSMTRTKR